MKRVLAWLKALLASPPKDPTRCEQCKAVLPREAILRRDRVCESCYTHWVHR